MNQDERLAKRAAYPRAKHRQVHVGFGGYCFDKRMMIG